MDDVVSAAMKSDKVALGLDDGADEKGRHRRTAFWRPRRAGTCLSEHQVRWWERKWGSDGPGEPPHALWDPRGRATRLVDGSDGIGAVFCVNSRPVRVNGPCQHRQVSIPKTTQLTARARPQRTHNTRMAHAWPPHSQRHKAHLDGAVVRRLLERRPQRLHIAQLSRAQPD